jgi:hypothetical protein
MKVERLAPRSAVGELLSGLRTSQEEVDYFGFPASVKGDYDTLIIRRG